MENENTCVLCFGPIQDLVKNADLPVCRKCLDNQAADLRIFHDKLKEDLKKVLFMPNTQNPEKALYQSEIDEIVPQKLFLGNFEAAENRQLLKEKQITHILVCGEFLDIVLILKKIQNFPEEFSYLQIPIQDSLKQTILEFLDQTYEFIKNGNVIFVHCAAGINRSPAIVCAYLMKANKWTYDQAFEYVKSKRSKANQQSNFAQQLYQYEQILAQQSQELA